MKNIAIWGITDDIWNDLKVHINWSKVELSFFIDRNPYADGIIYEGRRVHNFSDTLLTEIHKLDFILITAYSGYCEIWELLVKKGISPDKIQLYISEGLIEYYFGVAKNINKSLIEEIYYEPNKTIAVIDQYNHAAQVLEDMPPFVSDNNKWYKKYSIIAHACGGYIDGKKVMYSNSAEALKSTLESNAKVIECDVTRNEHNEMVCVHDFYRYREAEEFGYTIQNLDDIFAKIIYYPDVSLLIDVKWELIEEYDKCLFCILNSIEKAGDKKVQEQLKRQIIMEVYDETSIRSAQREGFDVFFIQYRNPDLYNYKEVAMLCLKYNIGVVGYYHRRITDKLLSVFKKKNISVFAYSYDSISQYTEMRQKGLNGIFSNFIRETACEEL